MKTTAVVLLTFALQLSCSTFAQEIFYELRIDPDIVLMLDRHGEPGIIRAQATYERTAYRAASEDDKMRMNLAAQKEAQAALINLIINRPIRYRSLVASAVEEHNQQFEHTKLDEQKAFEAFERIVEENITLGIRAIKPAPLGIGMPGTPDANTIFVTYYLSLDRD